ncbi:MAG TPA: hypothetical protein VKB78_16605 [Pirellulales bacterium]|nr:hypothetical protein [Pirellulales bacterium]
MKKLFRPTRFAAALVCSLVLLLSAAARAAGPPVYVILWFDTEDYILPADDDAAKHLAEFLTRQKIRGTFKVVGEKARTLERRGRTNVIEALKKHEIGYHSNYHSVEPTPAVYLNALGWDDGVAEFDRRERPGFEDVKRIFGTAPTCYGQPGSSWAPQTLGAMRQWGMKVYLDAGRHVSLDGKPFYYCGLLNIYQITHMPRADLNHPAALPEAEAQFAAARKELQDEGGGLVSIIYHPCEFVHKEFWDGVNFRNGANPPRERWKLPAAKTPEETQVSYDIFENYVRYMQHFDDVKFITASDAVKLYGDGAYNRVWRPTDVKQLATAVGDEPGFQRRDGKTAADSYSLSPAEVLAILSKFVAHSAVVRGGQSPFAPRPASGRYPPQKGTVPDAAIEYPGSPYGPSSPEVTLDSPITVEGEQFLRTTADVADSIRVNGRVPSAVWLGSRAVPPEAFLRSLALIAIDLADGKPVPETIEVKPARLKSAEHVANDDPGLWKWVIFPPNFHAPNVMALAKREAWTLKPAIRNDQAYSDEGNRR